MDEDVIGHLDKTLAIASTMRLILVVIPGYSRRQWSKKLCIHNSLATLGYKRNDT